MQPLDPPDIPVEMLALPDYAGMVQRQKERVAAQRSTLFNVR